MTLFFIGMNVSTWLNCIRYDSFSGQPTLQRSVALERACVLFNAGALCMQLAATQNLRTIEVCDDDIPLLRSGTDQRGHVSAARCGHISLHEQEIPELP